VGWNAEDLVKRIEDAAERLYTSDSREPDLTISPEERAHRARLESLRLSKTHTVERLERATNPAHREMLKRALRHLEAEMAEGKNLR
jgi:ribosomal protein L30/L7E